MEVHVPIINYSSHFTSPCKHEHQATSLPCQGKNKGHHCTSKPELLTRTACLVQGHTEPCSSDCTHLWFAGSRDGLSFGSSRWVSRRRVWWLYSQNYFPRSRLSNIPVEKGEYYMGQLSSQQDEVLQDRSDTIQTKNCLSGKILTKWHHENSKYSIQDTFTPTQSAVQGIERCPYWTSPHRIKLEHYLIVVNLHVSMKMIQPQ